MVFDHQSLMEAYINKKLLGHADLGKEEIHRRRQTITHFSLATLLLKILAKGARIMPALAGDAFCHRQSTRNTKAWQVRVS